MIKLKIKDQIRWSEHRSGWGYVLDALEAYNDESGILFDGHIDISFGYFTEEKRKNNILPYREDWIGFIHSSVTQCPFMGKYATLDSILFCGEFRESLEKCRGIFTLSEYVADYVRTKTDGAVLVAALKHPTEFPLATFDMEKFKAGKKIVHVGNWLRRITSFLRLKASGYNKILLLNPGTLSYLGDELNFEKNIKFDFSGIDIRQHLSNEEYDLLLAGSIVFIHLCDGGAANTVIECIARSTPIIVNRIRPVIEYLGEDYPLYYSSIEEAEALACDMGAVHAAHEYLSGFAGRRELTIEHFRRTFINSRIVKELTYETERLHLHI